MDTVPQNFRVLELSTNGDGEVIRDNGDAIQTALNDMGIGVLSIGGDAGTDAGADAGTDAGADASTDPGVTGGDDDGESSDDDDAVSSSDDDEDDLAGTNHRSLIVGGCAVSGQRSGFGGWALLAGLGLLTLRRRRQVDPAA